jgi:two-component sensor histidine kinase
MRSPLTADFVKTALAALIPLVVFAVVVIVHEDRRSRAELEGSLLDASRRLGEAVDVDLGHQLRTLSVLALSVDLDDPPNLAAFHEEARRAAQQHPGWRAVILVDVVSGRTLLNTQRPVGVALPPPPDDFLRAAQSHSPMISTRLARPEGVIQEPFITLRVPVARNDTVRYVLGAALSLKAVQATMTEQLDRELPRLARPAAGAAIMNEEGRMIARLIDPEKYAGELASAHTRENMRRPPGVYPGTTLEGMETYGAYTRSAVTGWSIVVAIRRADGDALANRSFWAILAGAVASIALAATLALQFGRDAARRRNERERLLLLEADRRLLQQAQSSVAEKEVLLREVHHRLKNNIQTIISLLRTSARHWPDEYQAAIRVAVRRMIAMVNVHEQLYRSPELAKLALGPYLDSIMRDVAVAEGAANRRIDFQVQAEDIAIDLNRALPVGLIMTECLINIFKHAFPGGRTGAITVSLTSVDGTARLCVRDDGVGLTPSTTSTRASLGLDLIETLAAQIGGCAATRALARGTEVTVDFPIATPQSRHSVVDLSEAAQLGGGTVRPLVRASQAP